MTEEEIVIAIAHNDCNQLKNNSYTQILQSKIHQAIFRLPCTNNTGYIPFESLTLFHVAAYYDSLECFLYLVDFLKEYNKSEKEIFSILSAQGYYPLHYALFNKSVEVSLYILYREKWQAGASHEGVVYYPLSLAVRGGIPEIVEELLKIGSDTITPKQIDQAFLMALSTRNYPCLKTLILKRASERPNKNIQETIPMKAAYTLSPDAVSLVLDYEDDSLDKIYYNQINGKFESDCLLSRLCRSKPPLFKKQIKKLLYSLEGKDIEPLKTYKVKGPCHWMCYFGDVEIAEVICDNFDIDINRLDAENQPGPFDMLRDGLDEEDIIKMLEFLVSRGFKINQCTKNKDKLVQKTLLEKFASFPTNKLKVIRYLLTIGADPDAPSFIRQGYYGTIRNYVKQRRDDEMIALFNEFPKKVENN